MNVSQLIRQRLTELGLEQKDLAVAADVTESYVSQLLAGKRLPPASERTDIYDRMGRVLRLPRGRLSELADLQRADALRRRLGGPPAPVLRGVRELILRKCSPARRGQIRAIFEKDAFGELERLVTQKLLDVAKRVAREELKNDAWLQRLARMSGRTHKQTRVIVLEFLDTDVFNVTAQNCVSFLDPLIESWDVDLASFAMEVVLSRRLGPASPRRFEFAEREPEAPPGDDEGLREFLRDRRLSGDASEDEIAFLRRLRFTGRRPTALYYYRELQNLRDPLHFRAATRAREPGRSRGS